MQVDRTILFADVCGSTRLIEALGDDQGWQVIGGVLQELKGVTELFRGTVIKTIGDEILSAFESPLDAISAAVDMQRAMQERTAPHGHPIEIQIGLHAGPVLFEAGDVFGDVVNVAARVTAISAAAQVLTTWHTLAQAQEAGIPTRSLGEHDVKGREERLHLHEILWREETAQLTILAPKIDKDWANRVELRVGDQVQLMSSGSVESLTLGRGARNALVVPDTEASRAHAMISARSGRFYLSDHSTNGTYVLPDGGTEIFIHRDEVLLQGTGSIRLGGAFSETGPVDIRYEVK
jgi:class 3 adenylate cyclase